jgi:hypothetical protein
MRNELQRCITCRQPSNAGGFRRLAFTKPANDGGKQRKEPVNPAHAAAGGTLAVILRIALILNIMHMKTISFLLTILIIAFSGCNPSKKMQSGKTYENFRGFEPIDPMEYAQEIGTVVNGKTVYKSPWLLTKDEILSFLVNETVIVSVGQFNSDGQLGYGTASFSMKNSNYQVTMDYMKFATSAESFDTVSNTIAGYTRVGVGLRIIANITSFEAGINLGDLFAIGLAAKANKISGTLMLEVIGIKSKDITNVLPLPSEINQSTIQSAMQAMATIKSKIYEQGTDLYPQIMAIKGENQNNNSFRAQLEIRPSK